MSGRLVSSDFLKLMTDEQQTVVAEKHNQRSVSQQQHEQFLVQGSQGSDEAVSKFIDSKVALLVNDVDYHKACLEGLSKAVTEDPQAIQKEREQILEALRPAVLELDALTRSKRAVSADVTEKLAVSKKRKNIQTSQAAMVQDQLPKAYAEIMGAYNALVSQDWKKDDFDRKKFRRELLQHYDASETRADGSLIVHCHLLGPLQGPLVTAAHVVPKAFTSETAQHLFGSNEQPTRDSPRNGLLLAKNIEQAFDRGDIAIVPIATDEGTPTRWKCILLNPELRGKSLIKNWRGTETMMEYRDIEDRELQFRNDNRPATRFLYFRFIMSLMHAKRRGRPNIVHELKLDDQLTTLWPSPGEYLSRSTLTTLTRSVSGLQLPESFINLTTFEGSDSQMLGTCDLSSTRPMLEMHEVMSSQNERVWKNTHLQDSDSDADSDPDPDS